MLVIKNAGKYLLYAFFVFFCFCGGGYLFSLKKWPRPKGNIILIPGIMVNRISIRPMAHFLNQLGYNVYLPTIGWNIWSLTTQVKKIQLFWQKQKIDTKIPLYIIGHSMGGLIAHNWIKNYGIKITKLITLGTPFLGSKAIFGGIWFFTPAAHCLIPKKKLADYILTDPTFPQLNVAADDDVFVELKSALLPHIPHYIFYDIGGHSALQMNKQVFQKLTEWL